MRSRVLLRTWKQIMNHSLRNYSVVSSPTEDVLFDEKGKKCVATLNRPKALNSLNLSMIHKLYRKLKMWENDPDVQLVIVKGAGEKAFCAGGDVVAIRESGLSDGKISRSFFYDEYKLNHLIGTYEVPYVALIDGVTMGGGVGISVHGMFRVATERTLFAMPETAIGLFPDVGGSYFLPRLCGGLGYFLALTGHRLRGRDVFQAGIATHFVKSHMLNELEQALLSIDGRPTKDTVGAILDRFHQTSEEPHEFVWAGHMDEISRAFSAQTMEEIIAKLRENGSEWASKQVEIMSKMSPTSMKVTLRQLQEGSNMDFKDVFTMEYRLCQRCVEDKKDFFEGVRAVLVDKDGKPKWDPDTLEGVTQEKLDWYFSPLPDGRDLLIV